MRFRATLIIYLTLASQVSCLEREDVEGPWSGLRTSSLAATPVTVPANGKLASVVTVHALDADKAPIPHANMEFFISGGFAEDAVTIEPNSGFTDADGYFSGELRGVEATTVTIGVKHAIDGNAETLLERGGATLTAAVQLYVGNPNHLSMSVSPSSVVADGISSSQIAVLVVDENGAAVPNANVELSSSGTHDAFLKQSGSTDPAGGFFSSFVSTLAEAKVVTATTNSYSVSAVVTFVAGAPAYLSITADPDIVVADNSQTANIVIYVSDSQGNAVVGDRVSLSAVGSGTFVQAPHLITDLSGHSSIGVRSNSVGMGTVYAGDNLCDDSVTLQFIAGPATTATLAANPNTFQAGGATMLEVVAYDAYGHPASNQNVIFSASGSGNSFDASSYVTDANGYVAAVLSSTRAETKSVTANLIAVSTSTSVSVVPGPPVPAGFSYNGLNHSANGTDALQVTGTVTDRYGNPVPNLEIDIVASGTNVSVTPGVATYSGSDGSFAFSVTSTTAQQVHVQFSFPGAVGNLTVNFQ